MTKVKEITLAEVKRRIKGLDRETQASMVCALVGCSRIQTVCFGYYNCARCGCQVGDTLASIYPGAREAVVVGHGCPECKANMKKLTWRDTFMAPKDPLKKPKKEKSTKQFLEEIRRAP